MASCILTHGSGDPSRENTSDEDTEDASESEIKPEADDNGKSGSFEEKIASLKAQLKQLEDGSDPEYLRRVREVEELRDKRLFMADTFRQYELQCSQEEYEREKNCALHRFEAKRLELKECLINELQDKKRAYENYRHTSELGAGVDSFEPKTMVTRKLRRRHYEPLPLPEKRRKSTPVSSLVYVLDDSEVDEDLKVIFKGKISTNSKTLSSPVPVSNNEGGIIYEARIEDGRVFYENRWFHKGQHVFIESKEHGQER